MKYTIGFNQDCKKFMSGDQMERGAIAEWWVGADRFLCEVCVVFGFPVHEYGFLSNS